MPLLEKKIDDIKLIFYHEFGHYLAFIFSTKNIEGFDIIEIKISKCPMCKNGFKGHIKPKIPKDYNNFEKLNPERLAHVFTNNFLGCILQIILSKSQEKLENVMLDYGQLDQKRIYDFINEYNLNAKAYEINEHFNNFCNYLRNKFENPFDNADFTEIFIEKDEEIFVNIEKIKELSSNFNEQFENEYFNNITNLINIIS